MTHLPSVKIEFRRRETKINVMVSRKAIYTLQQYLNVRPLRFPYSNNTKFLYIFCFPKKNQLNLCSNLHSWQRSVPGCDVGSNLT